MGISQSEIKNLIGDKPAQKTPDNLSNEEKIVILEIGCADGSDTKKFLNEFGSNLRIHTFDPEPINVEYMSCLGSKDAWGNSNDVLMTDKRHEFYAYAISGEDGETTFHRSRNDTPDPNEGRTVGRYSGSLHKPVTMLESPKYGKRWPGTLFDEEVTVQTKRIDTFCSETLGSDGQPIEHIDFMWMDTQGAERDVLKGIGSMIDKIDYIYTEYYDEEMYEGCPGLEEIKSLLPGFELVQTWTYNDADGGDVLFKCQQNIDAWSKRIWND